MFFMFGVAVDDGLFDDWLREKKKSKFWVNVEITEGNKSIFSINQNSSEQIHESW